MLTILALVCIKKPIQIQILIFQIKFQDIYIIFYSSENFFGLKLGCVYIILYLIFIKLNKNSKIQIYNYLVNNTLIKYQRTNSILKIKFLNNILKYYLYYSLTTRVIWIQGHVNNLEFQDKIIFLVLLYPKYYHATKQRQFDRTFTSLTSLLSSAFQLPTALKNISLSQTTTLKPNIIQLISIQFNLI